MEIIQRNEVWEYVDDGLQFSYQQFIVKIGEGEALYVGKMKQRCETPTDMGQLIDVQELQMHDRGPEVKSEWTVVTVEGCHVKHPKLREFVDTQLERRIAHEIDVCELLRRHPHPHLATCHGCRVTRGRVDGLCFSKYSTDLARLLSPGHLNKRAFLATGRPGVEEGMRQGLVGIRSAVAHLHSLCIVHNDIKPANIMIDDAGRFILIDFDSWRAIGASLTTGGTGKGSTYGWHDAAVTVATEKMDLDAVAEVETWLFGASEDDFMFDG